MSPSFWVRKTYRWYRVGREPPVIQGRPCSRPSSRRLGLGVHLGEAERGLALLHQTRKPVFLGWIKEVKQKAQAHGSGDFRQRLPD